MRSFLLPTLAMELQAPTASIAGMQGVEKGNQPTRHRHTLFGRGIRYFQAREELRVVPWDWRRAGKRTRRLPHPGRSNASCRCSEPTPRMANVVGRDRLCRLTDS